MLTIKVIGGGVDTIEKKLELTSDATVGELLELISKDVPFVTGAFSDRNLIYVNGRSIQRTELQNTKIRDGELVVFLNLVIAGGG